MKTTFSRWLSAALTVVLLLTPTLAAAQDGSSEDSHDLPHATVKVSEPRLANTPQVDAAQLCTRIGDLTGSVTNETINRFNQLNDHFTQRNTSVAADFDAAVGKITAARAKADADRQAEFARLTAKATTAAQKQAVAAFEAAVNQAVAARRAAVDAADATFRAGVLAAIGQRQTQLKTAATAYKNAVAAAIAAATASCTAGARPETVRANLRAALTTARANLQTARTNADKVHPNLDPLKAAHQAAIAQADATFKVAVAQALVTLKVALGTTGSPAPSPSSSPGA
jgi:hypothetical protein